LDLSVSLNLPHAIMGFDWKLSNLIIKNRFNLNVIRLVIQCLDSGVWWVKILGRQNLSIFFLMKIHYQIQFILKSTVE
jgi:hypothetical protein